MSRHPHWAGAAFLALILAASLALPSLAGAGGPSRSAAIRPAAVAAPMAGSPAPQPQPRRTPS